MSFSRGNEGSDSASTSPRDDTFGEGEEEVFSLLSSAVDKQVEY